MRVSATFLHGITFYAIDIDKKKFRTPFFSTLEPLPPGSTFPNIWEWLICRLVMKSTWWHFDKAPISSLTKFWQHVHFHAFTLLFCRLHLNIWSNGQLLNKRRHEKNHKHKESKLRLNTTLPLLSRLRLTKAGRSNNYSAQTSGFFRGPLIFIFPFTIIHIRRNINCWFLPSSTILLASVTRKFSNRNEKGHISNWCVMWE